MNREGNGVMGGKLVRPARPCRVCFCPALRERLPTLIQSFNKQSLFAGNL